MVVGPCRGGTCSSSSDICGHINISTDIHQSTGCRPSTGNRSSALDHGAVRRDSLGLVRRSLAWEGAWPGSMRIHMAGTAGGRIGIHTRNSRRSHSRSGQQCGRLRGPFHYVGSRIREHCLPGKQVGLAAGRGSLVRQSNPVLTSPNANYRIIYKRGAKRKEGMHSPTSAA